MSESNINPNAIAIAMATTIQVSQTTKNMLEQLKVSMGASATYESVILDLVKLKLGEKKSMYGAAKLGKWTKADRLKLRD